jgi:pyruvate dehydrogenase E1 component alpha subunit/2-oxoisovalerate dehydrogenase E1 component alpha subunit
VKRARAGRPPQLVVASTLRLAGHGEHDDASYVSDEIKREPFAQDALQRAEKFIVAEGFRDREALQQMRAEIAAEVDEAVATAQQEDPPQASEEDWCAVSTRGLVDQPTLT